MSAIHARLKTLGITLPKAAAPVANYVPYVRTGDLLVISGQIAFGPEGLMKGCLGKTMDVPTGQQAARLCALNLIAQANAALDGDLDAITRVVRLGGFVNATADFEDIPHVINGASDLMVEVFGDVGRHARAAVASPNLPLGTAVEVDAIFEVK
jgi:enamine deaminase RidA (YjgF/YER057c/UK114 family)